VFLDSDIDLPSYDAQLQQRSKCLFSSEAILCGVTVAHGESGRPVNTR